MTGHTERYEPLSRRRFFTLTGGLGATMALAAACGGNDAQTGSGGGGATYKGGAVTLQFWNGFTGADGPFAKKLVQQFSKDNPKITVKMNVYKWEEFYQKLPAAVTSGNGPDIVALHLDTIATQAAQQVIVPIDDVAKALKLGEADFSPEVWKGGLYKGDRYGIPLDIHPLGMYVNLGVLEKAGLGEADIPTTGDEYLDVLDELKGKGIKGHWMSPYQFTGGFVFESLLWQFGGELFDEKVTKATWDSSAGVDALTWCVDLVKKGYSPKNVGQDADYIAFKNNKNAFCWNGIWQIADCNATEGLTWTPAPVPTIGDQGGVWGNSHQFAIPRQTDPDTDKQDAARFFINYMSKHSLEWAKSGKVPAAKSVRESKGFEARKYEAPFAEELPDVRFPPPVAGISDALLELYAGVEAAVLLKKDPATALRDSAGKASKVIEDNAKKYGS